MSGRSVGFQVESVDESRPWPRMVAVEEPGTKGEIAGLISCWRRKAQDCGLGLIGVEDSVILRTTTNTNIGLRPTVGGDVVKQVVREGIRIREIAGIVGEVAELDGERDKVLQRYSGAWRRFRRDLEVSAAVVWPSICEARSK